MVVSLPINALIAKRQKRLQKIQMGNKDTRTRLMNEVLTNIKSIKLYGWEKAFSEKVLGVRNGQELEMLRSIAKNNSMSFFFWSTIPFLVAFGTFATYAYTSPHPLTSDKIFPAISLFQLLSFPMGVFSNIISSIIEATVSVTRIEDFLSAKELQKDARTVIRAEGRSGAETPSRGQEIVKIENGEFRWAGDSVEPTLQDIDFSIKKGELVGILGRVGDGKTSLISAILGEMQRSEGSVTVRGDVAYFSQSSFILSASIKDNIVFGTKFDPAFYEKVLDACALRPDLAIMPEGDRTQVGEKGVSLSGGQKARISLARCVYARADLYLLDDPLSAVDAHVGKHIWDNVFGPNGLLKSKARILCTNAITFLPAVDKIVMLRRGIILETSTYDQAMANSASEIYKLITTMGNQASEKEEEKEEATRLNGDMVEDVVEDEENATEEYEQDAARLPRIDRRMSIATMRRASVLSTHAAKKEAIRDLKEDSKPKEKREKGAVNRQVYRDYIAAASRIGVGAFFLCLIAAQASSIAGNLILRYWARANNENNANSNTATYLLLYGGIGILSAALSVASTLLLQVLCAIRCSKRMHDGSFAALMRAPMSFFEQTPQGRILNIFTRDINTIDDVLVRVFSGFFRTLTSVIGVIGVIAFGAPIVLIPIIPLAWVYLKVMSFYIATSRELKRLEAVSRSPVLSWFGEALAGAETVRAYNQAKRFSLANEARVQRNASTLVPAMNVNRWLAVRLEGLGSVMILAAAVASVLTVVIGKGKVDSGLTGIVMSYISSSMGALGWMVRSASDVESNITSVERVLGYTHLPSEAPDEIEEAKPVSSWPQYGSIEFRNYTAKYRPELDPSLRDVSLKIEGGHTVGVSRALSGNMFSSVNVSILVCLRSVVELEQERVP
jgi:ATP-binding cassette subfamily C (CFTR/MRP) protein 1